MPLQTIPNSVIAEVSRALARHYYSHSALNNLFMRCGALGDPPPGNLIDKSSAWVRRANEEAGVDAFAVLGCILEEYMDEETEVADRLGQRDRIKRALAHHGLAYHRGGRITGGEAGAPSRTLQSIIRDRDLSALEVEFERASASVDSDPPAAVTAACAIVESACKVYIEDEHLQMPHDQSVKPLWRAVQRHLGLQPNATENHDMLRVLGGLASIVDGVGSMRTHAGSAHGRGRDPHTVEARHARLAVHSAHTLVTFILESWDARRS